MSSPFDPSFEQLPATIPVFPLAGVLLLPRGRLPLNIFEPRYLAMIRDALAGDRLIGMVQPTEAESREKTPPLYPIACAGRITAFSETEDGRYHITLTGLVRFKILREIPTLGGYRRVQPDFAPYQVDMTTDATPIDRARLVGALRSYFQLNSLKADWASIEKAPDEPLVNSLAMLCPFQAEEKQALLEAPDLSERAKLLTTLVEMAALGGATPPARH